MGNQRVAKLGSLWLQWAGESIQVRETHGMRVDPWVEKLLEEEMAAPSVAPVQQNPVGTEDPGGDGPKRWTV